MKIALIHAPPCKIIDYKTETLSQIPHKFIRNADFTNIPLGLYSLAAQAKYKGYDVEVHNLSAKLWTNIIEIIEKSNATVFGISAYMSNQEGVFLIAKLIKQCHKNAKILVGGPQASALPKKFLQYCKEIDLIVMGEGEITFLEILGKLKKNQDILEVSGTAYKNKGNICIASQRPRIKNLDSLISPLTYFKNHIITTSRGCPNECTFCASKAIWGKKVTFHSVSYILEMLNMAVNKYGLNKLAFKDDTFTLNRDRVLNLCKGILKEKLNFIWSCDSRVDYIDEELIYYMRKAGCQKISFGIESGSEQILLSIKKMIDLDQAEKATNIAKKYGIEVRFFMILGNRKETFDTLHQTINFLHKCKPNHTTFAPFSIYPGTEEYNIYRKNNKIDDEQILKRSTLEYCYEFSDAKKKEFQSLIKNYFKQTKLNHRSIIECKQSLKLLKNSPLAEFDLGVAYYQNNNYEKAEKYFKKALASNFADPAMIYNNLACIEYLCGNYKNSKELFKKAFEKHPYHTIIQNIKMFAIPDENKKPDIQMSLMKNFTIEVLIPRF